MKTLVALSIAVTIGGAALEGQSLDEAQRLFYSARYDAAASVALEIRAADPGNLAASELRASALHFQIKRALGEPVDKGKALSLCGVCPELMAAFDAETAIGRSAARARLAADPADETALFFLGKFDLNYVWLQLGTLGRKTGLSEYWEARRSLDAVLKRNPDHVRARVARAWIDYIVGTRVPWGTRWVIGGGNKNRGLRTVRDAAAVETELWVQAEAGFALWDMQVRERRFAEAVVTAKQLSRDFPENEELTRFIARHDPTAQR